MKPIRKNLLVSLVTLLVFFIIPGISFAAPTAYITVPTTDPTVTQGTPVSFYTSDTATAYEWREGDCTTGTLLATNSCFDFATPTVGTYTIYLSEEDSQNTWSTNCPSVTVTVTPPPPSAQLDVNGNVTATIVSGNSATTTWNSSNANSCEFIVSPPSTGGAANNLTPGVSTGPLFSTQNYQISCTGPGGSADSNIATVNVVAPAVTITADPARVPSVNPPDNHTTLAWSTNDPANTKSCTVIGSNGFPCQSGTGSGISNSGVDSCPITDQTIFLISCQMADNSYIHSSVIVNIAPTFQIF